MAATSGDAQVTVTSRSAAASAATVTTGSLGCLDGHRTRAIFRRDGDHVLVEHEALAVATGQHTHHRAFGRLSQRR